MVRIYNTVDFSFQVFPCRRSNSPFYWQVGKIRPNLTSDDIYITIQGKNKYSRKAEINFIDITGRIIVPKIKVSSKNQMTVNVSELENGLYLLKI